MQGAGKVPSFVSPTPKAKPRPESKQAITKSTRAQRLETFQSHMQVVGVVIGKKKAKRLAAEAASKVARNSQ